MPDILQVRDLQTVFHVKSGDARVVNGFHLNVKEGKLLGLVGESGSGKTVTAMSIMGKVKAPGEIIKGDVFYKEVNLRTLSEKEMAAYRGDKIAMIAANARGHLNPLLKVGQQIGNVYLAHHPHAAKKEAAQKAVEMLTAVGINDAEQRAQAYPHELSGGMAQRVLIAMALINSPNLLIADDATNGLDVTVQAQIMELIMDMVKQYGMSAIFITHDLGVVAQCCDEIAIIYCGQVIEHSSVRDFFNEPKHPYSIKLLNSLPGRHAEGQRSTLGSENRPSPMRLPTGCFYHPNCPYANAQCKQQVPDAYRLHGDRMVKCFLAQSDALQEASRI